MFIISCKINKQKILMVTTIILIIIVILGLSYKLFLKEA
jgi:hypothetical protein